MKEKSKIAFSLCLLVVMIIVIMVLVFTGCQPTPDSEIVVGKDTEEFLNKAVQSNGNNQDNNDNSSSDLKELLGITEPYQYDADDAGGTIHLHTDASVIVPQTTELPIQKVELRTITQEEADTLIEVLFRGNSYFLEDDSQGSTRLKSDLEEILVQARKDLAEENFDTIGMSREELEAKIAQLEKDIATAPETLDEVATQETSNEFKRVDDGAGNVYEEIVLQSDLGNSSFALLYITNDVDNNRVNAEFYDGSDSSSQSSSISKEDAIEEASKLVEALGLSDQFVVETTKNNDGSGWRVAFTREIKGVPICSTVTPDQTYNESESYRPPMGPETLIIKVSDDGISEFSWTSPYAMGEMVTDNANLLSFDKVTQRFEELFFTKNNAESLYGGGTPVDVSYDVDYIQLCLMKIDEQDNLHGGIIAPVWVMCGSGGGVGSYDSAQDEGYNYDAFSEIHLRINAVDGSMV